jgi:hypothetical protein
LNNNNISQNPTTPQAFAQSITTEGSTPKTNVNAAANHSTTEVLLTEDKFISPHYVYYTSNFSLTSTNYLTIF